MCRFQEIKKKDKVAAMQFLQTSVSELIDHSDIDQTREVSQLSFKIILQMCFKQLRFGFYLNVRTKYYRNRWLIDWF